VSLLGAGLSRQWVSDSFENRAIGFSCCYCGLCRIGAPFCTFGCWRRRWKLKISWERKGRRVFLLFLISQSAQAVQMGVFRGRFFRSEFRIWQHPWVWPNTIKLLCSHGYQCTQYISLLVLTGGEKNCIERVSRQKICSFSSVCWIRIHSSVQLPLKMSQVVILRFIQELQRQGTLLSIDQMIASSWLIAKINERTCSDLGWSRCMNYNQASIELMRKLLRMGDVLSVGPVLFRLQVTLGEVERPWWQETSWALVFRSWLRRIYMRAEASTWIGFKVHLVWCSELAIYRFETP